MTKRDGELIEVCLDIGIYILTSGGEVTRVEDTVSRILSAYGMKETGVFTITSLIEVNTVTEEGEKIVQVKRIQESCGSNMDRLEKLNALARKICDTCPEVEEIRRELDEIMQPVQEPAIISYLGAILAACGFTVFFGGTLHDVPVTLVLACIINHIDRRGVYKRANQLLYYLVCSIMTGIVGSILVNLGVGLHLDKILIGCIMLTIPGIAITYSVRDMMLGEIITGLLRFAESLLIAASIASGYIFAALLMGGIK